MTASPRESPPAGSTINVSLQRVDTTMTWENPSSLDPQIDIIAPDGLVYANLRQTDDQPGVNYNATLTGAVLPLTGIYYLRAETLKGSGNYTLSFSIASVAPAPSTKRVIRFLSNSLVVPVNGLIGPTAIVLDPRGYVISGADVSFATVTSADDKGTAAYVGSSSATSTADGIASVTVRLTAIGKVELAPSLTNPILAQWKIARPLGAETSDEDAEDLVPRYPTVARQIVTPIGIDGEGRILLLEGSRTETPVWQSGGSRSVRGKPSGSKPQSVNPAGAGPGWRPASSADGPQPVSALRIFSTETITSCGAATFAEAAVNAPVGNPPYTMTLTDETPSTGQSVANGVVDAQGIHGHRVQKTIRLKIDLKDAGGSAPTYPVLVHMSLGGQAHGKLILDPDGNRVQCDEGTFLWHERDAQGNIIALNEEVEYQLGTYAPYGGAIPDPANPGQLKPVWAPGELLEIEFGTLDASGSPQVQAKSYFVYPEPGQPDHFVVSVPPPPVGTPDPVWDYWSDEISFDPVTINGRTGYGGVANEYNKFYLMDRFGNVTFGYASFTQPTAPATMVSVSFYGQTTGVTLDGSQLVDANGYGWTISWNDQPARPQGSLSAVLTLNYSADPDWTAGSVTKTVYFQFDRGTFHLIDPVGSWDFGLYVPCFQGSIQDPIPPFVVSPGATNDLLPKSFGGTVAGVTVDPDPARTAFLIGSSSGFAYDDPLSALLNIDVEQSDNPSFRVSLVDAKDNVATDAVFQVHLCPRFDHFPPTVNGTCSPRACSTAPVVSSGGVIQSIQVNANGPGAPDSQGYMGVELIQAPSNPGTYYIKFEALNGAQYRIRRTGAKVGEYKGSWELVIVTGVEILDQNFQRISPIPVSGPTPSYVRAVLSMPSMTFPMTLTTTREDGTVLTTNAPITLGRVGSSNTLIAPFTLLPEDYTPSSSIRTAGTSAAPTVTVAVGLTFIDATSPTASGTGEAVKAGKLRKRFMVRDQSCTKVADDSCLTAPDPQVPNDTPGRKQETYIDSANDYAERVRILIDVIDDKDQPVPGIKGKLTISESRNPLYWEENVTDMFGKAKFQLFYDGRFGATDLQQGKTLSLSNSRAMLELVSMAPARYKASDNGTTIETTLPYHALAKVAGNKAVSDLPDFSVDQWADERSYTKTRQNPQGTWVSSPGNGSDWLEMKAGDFLAAPASANSSVPEADAVLKSVARTKLDLTLTSQGRVNEADPTTVWLKPDLEPFRRTFPVGIGFPYHYYGLQHMQEFNDIFKVHMSHEARHSWVFQLGLSDGDHDFLPSNPPASSPELKDSPFGQNPEAQFQGDTVADRNLPYDAWRVAVFERNAVRFAAKNTSRVAVCDLKDTFAVSRNGSTLTISIKTYAANPQNPAQKTGASGLPGVFIEIYNRPSDDGTCVLTDAPWTKIGLATTDMNGNASLDIGTMTGVFGVRWRRPIECAGSYYEGCAR